MVVAKARERGATLLLIMFVSTCLLIPIVGTCIDGAMLYWVQGRLSGAVDATALAAARALNVGNSDQEQIEYAKGIGQYYFTANFPTGSMKITVVGGAPRIEIDPNGPHLRVVTVSASVTVPLLFMPILGFNNQVVSASGQATRRDANVMMVLDRSGSMNNASGSCGALRSAAQFFVSQFVNGRDQLGLVSFQTNANLDYQPTAYFNSGSSGSLSSVIGSLVCGGDTGTAQGLHVAWDQIQYTINEPGALNVIVLFTDGQPNAIVGKFPIKKFSDVRYDPVNTGSLMLEPASNCQPTADGTLDGVIGDGSNETATSVNNLNATGYTLAVFSPNGMPLSTTAAANTISARGCAFYNANNSILGRLDVAYIPDSDAFNNSLADRGIMPKLDRFESGQYATHIRPDMPRTLRWAAFNAVDSMAETIRSNATYGTVIYTIGLAGNEPMAMDTDFMERVANDPIYSGFNSSQPQGKFYYAANNSEVLQAFQGVAAQIIRLSK